MIVVWDDKSNKRSQIVCEAMSKGLWFLDIPHVRKSVQEYKGTPEGDVAVFYGKRDKLFQLRKDYRTAGKTFVYIDLGYWGRLEGSRYEGYHKVTVNDYHPTWFFQLNHHPCDRFARFGLEVKEKEHLDSGYVLIPGMSLKQACVSRYGFEEWERETIAKIRTLTKRPIAYKPKDTCGHVATEGLADLYIDPKMPIDKALGGAYVVVTKHSNVGVDALLNDVPLIAQEGVASCLSQDWEHFGDLKSPPASVRRQFMCDLAYTQWSVPEMRTGECWKHLQAEGLL